MTMFEADDKEKATEFLQENEQIIDSDTTTQEIAEKQALRQQIIAALKTVHDPEIPVNIYDLGLIYNIDINDNNFVKIDLTLTAPGCPVAHLFPNMVKGAVTAVDGVNDAEVELVWDPPWNQEMMSEAAKLELGIF